MPAPAAPALELAGVATDSRDCRPGCLFACIAGSNVDGHDYARQAVENGAAAILAEKDLPVTAVPVLVVPDTIRALGSIAALWRSKTRATVVCITGTAGKTTLKDLLADMLAQAGSTAKSEKNHNNQLGMALSILQATGSEKFWVMEAGISHAGDMAELGAICRPDVAIIVNAGAGHTEGLGSGGVARHKSELLKYLTPDGTGLVSADYPDLAREAAATGAKILFFSLDAQNRAAFRLEKISGRLASMNLAGETCGIDLGENTGFPLETLLAAGACANFLGLNCDAIQAGFNRLKMPEHRFNLVHAGKWLIIDDTYNANPLSMRRTLETASLLARERKLPLVAILGEMGELGEQAALEHRRLGGILRQISPARVFWHGNHLLDVAEGIETSPGEIATLADPARFQQEILHLLASDSGFSQGCVMVFKGSRLNRMEEYLGAFCQALQINSGDGNVL